MSGEASVTLADATRVWLRVALLSFGGPAGQIATMHRIVVEEQGWISERRFLHALNYCMLLPGPEAQQLATYLGWLMHGAPGALIAGGLFILPGVAAIMALSIVYALYGGVGVVAGLFFGLKAAVLAIVAQAVLRIGARALATPVLIAIAVAAFIALFAFAAPFPLVIAAAAALGVVLPGRRETMADDAPLPIDRARAQGALRLAAVFAALWLAPVAALIALLGPDDVFATIAVFFSKMAMVTFGGAYAALAYVAQRAVETYGWLAPGEMLDGLGMAETTPGPLITVLQFVGFMAAFRAPGALSPVTAGVLGGLLASWVTFMPCFVWIFLGAPFIERLRGHRALGAALAAVTAAVVGVIFHLALWFAIHALFREQVTIEAYGLRLDLPMPGSLDPIAAALAVAALVAVFWARLGTATILAGCACAGAALHFAGLSP